MRSRVAAEDASTACDVVALRAAGVLACLTAVNEGQAGVDTALSGTGVEVTGWPVVDSVVLINARHSGNPLQRSVLQWVRDESWG